MVAATKIAIARKEAVEVEAGIATVGAKIAVVRVAHGVVVALGVDLRVISEDRPGMIVEVGGDVIRVQGREVAVVAAIDVAVIVAIDRGLGHGPNRPN